MRFAIYNLYPRLIGNINNWYIHVDRIKEMGFSWIYINPITEPGFSGSLYATKSYYNYNPMFFDNGIRLYAESDIKKFNDYCKSLGINVMLDLVINHSSKDCELITEYPHWYEKDENGDVVSPGAFDNGHWVCWGDLASFDNNKKEDNSHLPLWQYWKEFISNSIYLGFKGFRCDAAYKVPSDLWQYLIAEAKKENSDVIFFAESLGCSVEDTLELAESGFDYVASSVKWWDFTESWFLEQYKQVAPKCKYITFVENHDTQRAITEYGGNIDKLKMEMIFTSIVGEAWVMTYGFEYGARNRCDVVHDSPKDKENIHYDISDYITRFIKYMKSIEVLACLGQIEVVELYAEEEQSDDIEEYTEEEYAYQEEYTEEQYVDGQQEYIEQEYAEEYTNDNINAAEESEEEEIEIENTSSIRAFYKYNLDKSERVLIIMNISEQEDVIDLSGFNIKKDISFENAFNINASSFDQNSIFIFAAYEVHIFELLNGND